MKIAAFGRQLAVSVEYDLRAFKNYFWSVFADLVVKPFVYVTLLCAGLSGFVAAATATSPQAVLAFLLPGVTATLFVGVFSNVISQCTMERRWGTLALKFRAGMTRGAYLTAVTLFSLALFWVQFAFAAVGFLLLSGATADPEMLWRLLLRGSFCAAFWVQLGLAIGCSISNYQVRDTILSVIVFPILYTAPTFFPLETAPPYLAALSQINPLTYHLGVLRCNNWDWTSRPFVVSVAMLAAVTLLAARRVVPTDKATRLG